MSLSMSLSAIIASYGLCYHFYVDNTQLYVTFNHKDWNSLCQNLKRLENCIANIRQWTSTNMLKLNDDKTEVLYIASPCFQKSMPSESSQIGDTAVSQARIARNIGVIFDETMSMKDHISSICKTSHFYLRNISAIRKYLTQDACATLVHSLVSPKTWLL